MTPYTRRIKTNKLVSRLRMQVSQNFLQRPGIDAIRITSSRNFPENCRKCEELRLQYHVFRDPSFANLKFKITKQPRFKDQ